MENEEKFDWKDADLEGSWDKRMKNMKDTSLKSSWDLKAEIKNLSMSDSLRKEVDKFIEFGEKKYTGKDRPFSNVIYRGNLHYIIDNIGKEEKLIKELRNFPLS